MLIKILAFIVIILISSIVLTSLFFLLIRRGFIVLNELTPDIDEIKEILRGNIAASQYFGRIISAFIIGISIIISTIIFVAASLVKW